MSLEQMERLQERYSKYFNIDDVHKLKFPSFTTKDCARLRENETQLWKHLVPDTLFYHCKDSQHYTMSSNLISQDVFFEIGKEQIVQV